MNPELVELALKIEQQFFLVALSTLIALLLGIPLGIVIVRFPRIKSLTLSFISAMWTIPSLALLAMMIPFVGIGFLPAILTLSLYALLPIIRNTVSALENIPSASIEAANALGFSNWQRLWIVELPLALPVMVTGIKTAVSITIGIATLAAFIGAGGLGDFINRGIAMNNTHLLLLGAIPAAVMALLADYIIGKIEKIIEYRKQQIRPYQRLKYVSVVLVVSCITLTSGFVFAHFFSNNNTNTVRIATKNFTEQFILGELMAQLIEANTQLHVERKFNLGETAIVQQALLHGDIDLYPEYTGTAFLNILHQSYNGNPQQIFQLVKNYYLKNFHLLWLPSFGFANSQAIAVKNSFAKKYHLQTISDLKTLEKQISIGVPAAFISRADGLIGMKHAYQLNFGQIKQMDPGLMYQAINNNEVDAINAFTTDSRIIRHQLTLLTDDKHFYPPYDAAIVIREQTLKNHPEIYKALQPLFGKLTEKMMQQLNYQADIEKKSPAEIVRKFLIMEGLISEANFINK